MGDSPHQRSASRTRRDPGEAQYEAIRVGMLGGFRVSVGSRTIAEDGWRLRKAANLIKLLALKEGHRLHRERIMASGFSLSVLASSEYDYEGYVATVRSRLNQDAFEAAWSEGRSLSLEEAVEYALGSEDTSPAPGEERDHVEGLDLLTRSEREVSLLIGEGFTNREVAWELSINERTVETHVGKILRKLRLRSRTQIAARMAHQGLVISE